ncbi:V-type ATPase 116kDa subunit family protein [Desulforegula conservatrix]|uniref:V-type ATPase 116kDa subunit family protein n=1 Tax=Desulforegula conservatrix TaxID=153026 RepID=UPI001E398CE4|nr:V-type ATPase 116kDa subunit family protein [Desulforegula conservatrix]
MKKITVIFDSVKTEETLCALREYGSFHPSPGKKPESPEIEMLKKNTGILDKALSLLPETKDNDDQTTQNGDLIGLANNIIATASNIKIIHEDLKPLEKELDSIKKWGKSDKTLIDDLINKGINIRFFRCPKKDMAQFPDNVFSFYAFDDGGMTVAGVVLYNQAIDSDLGFQEVFPPLRNVETVAGIIKEKEKKLLELEIKLESYGKLKKALEDELLSLQKRLEFETVKAGIIEKDRISILTGFCPESEADRLKKLAEKHAWAIMSEAPDEKDPAPTLVRHSKISGLFSPVMDFVGIVPAYHEYDASMSFLVFFTIFFAILVGDAGYGVIILIATFLFSRFTNRLPQNAILLLYLLSTAAIIWGAISGIWFASERIAEIPFFRAFIIPSIFGFSPESDISIPRICMVIAFLQLASAHVWRAARAYPSLLIFAEAGWIAVLGGVFFIIDFLILNSPVSPLIKPLVIFGSICVLIFAGQNSDGFKSGMIRGLKNMPMTLLSGIGCFSDTVSYIRLFAVGLASKEMAVAFNNIALSVGFESFIPATAAVLILISGHAINIALAVMAVLVHGIRLNFLEYSTHLNMEWTGIKYAPFR